MLVPYQIMQYYYVITIFKTVNNLKAKMIYKVYSICLTIAHHQIHLHQILCLDTLTLIL